MAQSVADRIIGPYTFGDSTRKISDWMEWSLGNCVSADIFSGFTGLAYVDIMLLHPHHIGRTADGRRYIRINRKKTNVEAFIPLHPIAEQILDLYNTTDDTKPVFPLPSRDEMWFEIHELGVAIGREENLSYHQARHSFGTFFDFGGNTHRKHRQDDGPLRYKNNPAVRGGYGQENFKGHGQPDGGQNDVRNRQMVQKARIAKRNRL